jgi:pantothenate kinase
MSKELQEAQAKVIFSEVTEDLAETQIEKIRALSEGLDYDDIEDYSSKLNTLKESYFEKKQASSSDVEDQEPVELDEEVKPLPGEMAKYAAAISRTVRK